MEEQQILVLQCLYSSNMFQHLRNAAPKVGPSGKSENRANIAQGIEQRPAADHAAARCCDILTSHRPTLSRIKGQVVFLSRVLRSISKKSLVMK